MKKYLFGLFALVLAVGFSAFTAAPVKKSVTSYFFQYNDPSPANLLDETKWEYVGTVEPQDCGGSDVNCTIELPFEEVSGHADFSSAQITEKEDLDLVTISSRPE